MPDDPRLEPRIKLMCKECGFWMHPSDILYGRRAKHCGRTMVETYGDPGFLTMEQAVVDLKIRLSQFGWVLIEESRLYKLVAWLDGKIRRWSAPMPAADHLQDDPPQ